MVEGGGRRYDVVIMMLLDSTHDAILVAIEQWNVHIAVLKSSRFLKVVTWLPERSEIFESEPSLKIAKSKYNIDTNRKLQVSRFSIENETARRCTTIRTRDNIEIIRRTVESSPHHSASKHCAALGISECTV